jgi:hypothetical protein
MVEAIYQVLAMRLEDGVDGREQGSHRISESLVKLNDEECRGLEQRGC